MNEPTQAQVDKAYTQIKSKWNQMRKEFKGSDCLFVMSREAIDFLGQFEIMREQVLEQGFKLQPLDDKIKVTLSD